MKNFRKILFPLAFAAVLFSGCSDDDDDNGPSEVNFLNSYLALGNFNDNIEPVEEAENYEFGLYFRVETNGDMERIALKLPFDRDNVRVTVWNVDTETAIRTENIDVQAGVTNTVDIDDIDLVVGTQYAITMNSDAYYYRYADDNQLALYPFIVGNVIIDSYRFRSGTDQILPTETTTSYYAGDLSFTFDAD